MNEASSPAGTEVGATTGTACILAGGRGTRLRSVLSDRPKPLAPVGGRPFVTRLLDQVTRAGWGPVVLCTGYMADSFEEALGREHAGVELVYSREAEALGTAGAVRQSLPLLESDPVLVANGDSYADVDLAALLDEHRQSGARATLALVEVDDAGRYGRVLLDTEGPYQEGPYQEDTYEGDSSPRGPRKAGWIERFDEKMEGAGAGLINAGLYILSREVIEAIPEGRTVSVEREVFPALIGRGLRGSASGAPFLDIGTPESLARAESFFRQLALPGEERPREERAREGHD